MLPNNLPKLLRDAGLTVVEVDGWRNRKRPGAFVKTGVLNHHTGASARGWSHARELEYAKWMFLTGRSDLPAPLCQIALGRSGRVYLGAAGRANHAGRARASGSVAGGDGNRLYIGIEWMLSGSEEIPASMRKAAVTLNAVLTKEVTGNSVQTISSHYQTSVTGKWDVGDPNGVTFRDKKVLAMGPFRQEVKEEIRRLSNVTAPRVDGETLRVMHTSMQFSDSARQQRHDVEKIFERAADKKMAWITGTEAAPGAGPLGEMIREVGRKAGYRMWVPSVMAKKGARTRTDGWLAVNRDLLAGGWRRGYVPVLPDSGTYYRQQGLNPDGRPRWAPRGIVWAGFNTENLGRIHVGTSHYVTHGKPGANRPAARVNVELNEKLADAIGKWARNRGKGSDLAFYHGDQNINDRRQDTFFGNPLTSAWDEIGKWRKTGQDHSTIDVIASFDRDNRVDAADIWVLNDGKFFLHTDHFPVVADYRVRALKA